MADSEQIKRVDVIAADVFTQPAEEAKILLDQINLVVKGMKEMLAVSSKDLSITTTKDSADVAKMAAQIKDLEDKIKLLTAAKQKQAQAEKILTVEQAKLNIERQKQRQAATEQAKQESDLTSAYEKQVTRLAQIKRELKEMAVTGKLATTEGKKLVTEFKNLDKSVRGAEEAVGEHTRSVGNYGNALKGVGGKLGGAAEAVEGFGGKLKALLLNPVVLFIAAISAALYGLFKAFVSTDSGANQFAIKMEQLKGILDVVRLRAISLIDSFAALFKGDFTEASKKFGEAVSSNADDFKAATKGAEEYVLALDDLEDSENNYISKRAENALKIAMLEYDAADRSKSTAERRKALIEAIAISKEQSQHEVEEAKKRLNTEAVWLAKKNKITKQAVLDFIEMSDLEQENASEAVKKARDNNEKEFNSLEELHAKVSDADRAFYEENKRNKSKLSGFEDDILKEKLERIKKEEEALQELERIIQENFDNEERIIKLQEDRINKKTKDREDELKLEQQYSDEQDRLLNDDFDQLEASLKAETEAITDNINTVNKIETDAGKEKLARERQQQDQVLAGIREGVERREEIIQSGIQKELTQTERAIERQQQLAAQGLENTLAYQEKRRAELEAKAVREKEAARQKEEAIQLAGAYLSAYRARMDKGNQTSTAALSGALSDVLLAKAISSSVAGAFAEGVEDFQGKGTGTSDSNLIAFSHGESVVTAKATKQYSGLVTAMNKGLVDDYVNEMIMPDLDARPSSNGGSFSSAAIVYALTKEMGELRQAIKNKQEIKVNWDAQGARVEEIVKDGMRVVTKHVTTGKRRL